ncbi:MAG: trypsin-like peptidase domain-containing protein [Candidatus Nitrotoga sp.]
MFFALPLSALALTPSEVFEQVKDSVFVVKTFDALGKQKGMGSAVLLPTGKIATNCHVIEGGVRFEIGRNEQFAPATLYASDHDKDICLLDTKDPSGKAAQLGRAASLKVGEPVYAVGAPQGLELSFSDGIVSQLRGSKPPLIQTTAAISPGSSGGGLFDSEARLVGLTTLYIDGGQNLNFAMPVEWLAEIKSDRKVVRSGGGRYANLLEANAWYNLGDTYRIINRPTDAIDAFRQSLRIDPENADAWFGLGLSYVESDNRTAALEVVKTLRRLDPKQAEKLFNMLVPR